MRTSFTDGYEYEYDRKRLVDMVLAMRGRNWILTANMTSV